MNRKQNIFFVIFLVIIGIIGYHLHNQSITNHTKIYDKLLEENKSKIESLENDIKIIEESNTLHLTKIDSLNKELNHVRKTNLDLDSKLSQYKKNIKVLKDKIEKLEHKTYENSDISDDDSFHEFKNNIISDFDYPKKDSNIVSITMKQVFEINNDYEILKLFRNIDKNNNESDELFIKIINGKNEEIALLELKYSELEKLSQGNNEVISKLKEQIKHYLDNEYIYINKVNDKDEEIKVLKKVNKTNKMLLYGSAILNGILIINSLK